MRLQVSLTVGGQTNQTGLQGSEVGLSTDVTGHFIWFSRILVCAGSFVQLLGFPDLVSHPRNESIDQDVWSLIEDCLTQWTLTHITGVPVMSDAGFAVVVSTWSADWISEHIQTDRTQELLFRQDNAGRGHGYTLKINKKDE